MKHLYHIYQIIVALPILLVTTILTALVTSIGCFLGDAHFWGYYPGKIWSQIFCRILLIPVKVEGHQYIDKNTSYVFVANHQGPMDIFLIYGFLGRNFKWMMKKSLRNIPLVGYACEKARHIFVDKSGPKKYRKLMKRHVRLCREEHPWLYFPKVHAPTPVTWDHSEGCFSAGGRIATTHRTHYD